MAKKREKAQELSPPEKLVQAALDLAGQQPWRHITLQMIYKVSGVTASEAMLFIDDKADILALYGRMIDRQTLDAYGMPDITENERDRLFEIFMARFDCLNSHKPALASILKDLWAEPKAALTALPHLKKSIIRMADGAGLRSSRWNDMPKLIGLTGVYLHVLRIWLKDDSPDMAKTMAALDQALDRLYKICKAF